MTRRLVLIVSADLQHLPAHHATIQESGYWWALPASSLERAHQLLLKVRPALVLYDLCGGEEQIDALHHLLHGGLHPDAHLTILGEAPFERQSTLSLMAGKRCAHCEPCPHCGTVYQRTEGHELIMLLARILGEVALDEKYPPGSGAFGGRDTAPSSMPTRRDGWRHEQA